MELINQVINVRRSLRFGGQVGTVLIRNVIDLQDETKLDSCVRSDRSGAQERSGARPGVSCLFAKRIGLCGTGAPA